MTWVAFTRGHTDYAEYSAICSCMLCSAVSSMCIGHDLRLLTERCLCDDDVIGVDLVTFDLTDLTM